MNPESPGGRSGFWAEGGGLYSQGRISKGGEDSAHSTQRGKKTCVGNSGREEEGRGRGPILLLLLRTSQSVYYEGSRGKVGSFKKT